MRIELCIFSGYFTFNSNIWHWKEIISVNVIWWKPTCKLLGEMFFLINTLMAKNTKRLEGMKVTSTTTNIFATTIFFLCTIIPCYAICTVSLMAFSGQTPTSWGPRPRYSPSTPSWRMTFLKQSQLFLYINSPTMGPDLWFCILVFTKSIG